MEERHGAAGVLDFPSPLRPWIRTISSFIEGRNRTHLQHPTPVPPDGTKRNEAEVGQEPIWDPPGDKTYDRMIYQHRTQQVSEMEDC